MGKTARANSERKKDTHMIAKIIGFLRECCALDEKIDETTELKILSLDSLSFIEFLVRMEEEFGVEFEPEELDLKHWVRVDDIYKSVKEKLNASESINGN